jgi:hypothetical protein
MRSRLRQSRSSVILPSSNPNQVETTNWDQIHPAYRPVERANVRVVDGYYLNQPLPGPPPRPRSTTPFLASNPRASLDIGNLKNPAPRTHRTRSAEIAQRRWSGLDNTERDGNIKTASVSLAIALPPDHLEPPPPYSRYPEAPSNSHQPRPRSQPPPCRATHYIKPYDPNDYVRPRSQDMRSYVDVPIITAPQPPTPVSPLNSLDLQYLGLGNTPASASTLTIDNLLAHPMLRHR